MSDVTMAAPQPAPRKSRVVEKFMRNRGALIGGAVVLFFVACAVLAPLIAPYDPNKTNFLLIRKPPSALYWFGTDDLGRDMFTRMLYGARASLLAGVSALALRSSSACRSACCLAGMADGSMQLSPASPMRCWRCRFSFWPSPLPPCLARPSPMP